MPLSLQDVAGLQDTGRYYLSDQGTIEKQGFLTKLKCFFNWGHSRERVQNLVNEIQATLIKSIPGSEDQDLYVELSNLNMKKGIQGDTIKNIFSNFQIKHASDINRQNVLNLVSEEISQTIKSMHENYPSIQSTNELKDLFQHALKPVQNKIQYSSEQFNLDEIRDNIKDTVSRLAQDLISITQNEDLGQPSLNANYVKYLQTALFSDSGERLDKDLATLDKPQDAKRSLLYAKLPKDSDEYKKFLDSLFPNPTAMSDELLDILSNQDNLGGILVSGDNNLRPIENVKAKIDGFIKNLDEIKFIESLSPQAAKAAYNTLKFSTRPFPAGALTSIYNSIQNINLDNLKALNPKSNALNFHQALHDLKVEKDKLVNNFVSDNYDASPNDKMNCDVYIYSLIMQRLNQDEKINFLNTLTSSLARKVCSLYEIARATFDDDVSLQTKDAGQKIADDLIHIVESSTSYICDFFNLPQCYEPLSFIGPAKIDSDAIIENILNHAQKTE